MSRHSTLMAIALAAAGLMSNVAQAQPTAKEQYDTESKRIATRYADDKKICASEGDSATRMQCNRDAKSEYDKAMANAKAALKASSGKAGGYCGECAKVLAVNVGEKAGEGSALGVIAGGVAGALLGNQVGGGSGRQLGHRRRRGRRRLRGQPDREESQVHQGLDRAGAVRRRPPGQLPVRSRPRPAGGRPREERQRQHRAQLMQPAFPAEWQALVDQAAAAPAHAGA